MEDTAPNLINPGLAKKITQSGKIVQQPTQRHRKLVINSYDNVDIAPTVAGDTWTAAQREEDQRREEGAKEKDLQVAWVAAQGSTAGRSQGTSSPRDPVANIPKRSRCTVSPQTGAPGSSVPKNSTPAPSAQTTAKRSAQDPSGGSKEPPKKKPKPSSGFVKAVRYNLQPL